MDVVIGVLFAALVIGVSAAAGRSLDRANRERDEKDRDSKHDVELYGDF